MSKLPFKIAAGITAALFSVAALFCCYRHPAISSFDKPSHSCCASKHTTPASKTDCGVCPIVQKSVDVAGPFVLKTVPVIDFTVLLRPHMAATHAFEATLQDHGPPGKAPVLALYLQFHSLRL